MTDYRQWWVDYFILMGHTRKRAEAKVAAKWPGTELTDSTVAR